MITAKQQAKALLILRERERRSTQDFYGLYADLHPNYDLPLHLDPFVQRIERIAKGEAVHAATSCPPQHGKTVSAETALVYMRCKRPGTENLYATYSQSRANSVSRATQRLMKIAGYGIRGNIAEWWCDDTVFRFAGLHGGVNGVPVSGVAIIDDSIKDMSDALSEVIREDVSTTFKSTVLTRVHPGASILAIATRWHREDLVGELVRDHNYEEVNLPAINEVTGEALWPERRPLDWLGERRAECSEFVWSALYMGNPRAKGTEVFRDTTTYASLPPTLRIGIGIDFAYSTKSSADYSVAVILGEYAGQYYLLDVRRVQQEATVFGKMLRSLQMMYPQAQLFSYIGGQEGGIVDLMRVTLGVNIHGERAVADKFARAQPASVLWNTGRLLVPDTRSMERKQRGDCEAWLNPFLSEIAGFTGQGDRHDDQVDALAGAVAALSQPVNRRNLANLLPR